MGDRTELLSELLQEANRRSYCVDWACTTCGAMEFREAVLRHVGATDNLALHDAKQIAAELGSVKIEQHPMAVEFLLRWLDQILGAPDLARAIEGTSAGRCFEAMRARHAQIQERCRIHRQRNDPAFVEAERIRKKAERAAKHAERLRLKALRDAKRP